MEGTSRPKKWDEYGEWLSPFSRRLYKLPWVTGWKSHSGHGSNIGGKVRDGADNIEEWCRRDNHLSGFIEAIAVSEVIDMDVLLETIDRSHLEIFGESRVERRKRMQKLRQSVTEMDWKRLDTQAVERIRPRRR